MNRLSPQLKKRLKADLGQLTAREAGRLLLIYLQEGAKKDKSWDKNGYPPYRELWEAFQERIDKSRGKPEEGEAVDSLNGLLFLYYLIRTINFDDFPLVAMAFSFDSYRVMVRIATLLREDVTTQLIRFMRTNLFSNSPKPISRDHYVRYAEWLPTTLETICDAAFYIVDMKIEDGEIEEKQEDEGVDQVDEEYNRAYDVAHDALTAALANGDLQGGEALFHDAIFSPILVEGGQLPAWAALRILWDSYLMDKGYRVLSEATFADWSPDFVDQVYTSTGELVEGDDLRKLAAGFYKDCRRRPWGKGLVAKADPGELVKLLTQSPNPFLHICPANFGVVDWKAFSRSETNTYGNFELKPAATLASLTAISAKIWKSVDFSKSWHEDLYYPSTSPEERRRDLARTLAMMNRLDTSRQPFTFGWMQKNNDELSLSDLLGINFLTPLEMAVGELRKLNNYAVSIRQSLRIISDRYFGGQSLFVGSDTEELLLQGEEYLKIANEALAEWVEQLARWPWQVDVSSLAVIDPTIDDNVAEKHIDRWIARAKSDSRIDNPDALLGKE